MSAVLHTADIVLPKSLFAKVKDARSSVAMATQVHRLIMLVRLSSGTPPTADGRTKLESRDMSSPRYQIDKNRRDVLNQFESYTKSWRDCHRGDLLTGVVMYYPDFAICVLECSSETLTLAMRDIAKEIKLQQFCLSGKVLSYGTSISCRLFREWSSRILPPFLINVQEDLTLESVAHNLPPLLDGILKLGRQLVVFPRTDLSTHVDRLRQNFSHLIIPTQHFEYLITREEISPVSEFLWRYHNRHEKYDATEKTWPAPAMFRPPKKAETVLSEEEMESLLD